MTKIIKDLLKLQDAEYRDFHAKLMPNIEKDRIIGIRIPVLRKYAKEISGTKEAEEFIKVLPHFYYEENNLHSFLIEQIKDFDKAIEETERFLPFIDNWATCDSLRPKVFAKYPERLSEKAIEWTGSDKTYTVRFGIETLMTCFLDGNFNIKFPALISKIRSEEYYVNMMIAWYFATALSKQYKAVLPFVENKSLDKWTHNKTIQKATESYRITKEQKEYLRRLKL